MHLCFYLYWCLKNALTETASPSMRSTPARPTTSSTSLRTPARKGIGANPCLLSPSWRNLKRHVFGTVHKNFTVVGITLNISDR